MTRAVRLVVTVWRLFVADRALAGFIVCWAALFWFAGGYLGATLPAAMPATLLAVGPIVALWCSVQHAARTLRSRRLEDKASSANKCVGTPPKMPPQTQA